MLVYRFNLVSLADAEARFRFVSRSVQDKVVFERNDDYYGEKPALSKVTCKIYEDNNALFTAVDSGALDMAFHLTVDQVNNLTNGYNVIEGEMNLVQALYLNNNVEPFDNVQDRRRRDSGADGGRTRREARKFRISELCQVF